MYLLAQLGDMCGVQKGQGYQYIPVLCGVEVARRVCYIPKGFMVGDGTYTYRST